MINQPNQNYRIMRKLLILLSLQSAQIELEKKMTNKILLNENIDDVKLDLTCNVFLQHLTKTEK